MPRIRPTTGPPPDPELLIYSPMDLPPQAHAFTVDNLIYQVMRVHIATLSLPPTHNVHAQRSFDTLFTTLPPALIPQFVPPGTALDRQVQVLIEQLIREAHTAVQQHLQALLQGYIQAIIARQHTKQQLDSALSKATELLTTRSALKRFQILDHTKHGGQHLSHVRTQILHMTTNSLKPVYQASATLEVSMAHRVLIRSLAIQNLGQAESDSAYIHPPLSLPTGGPGAQPPNTPPPQGYECTPLITKYFSVQTNNSGTVTDGTNNSPTRAHTRTNAPSTAPAAQGNSGAVTTTVVTTSPNSESRDSPITVLGDQHNNNSTPPQQNQGTTHCSPPGATVVQLQLPNTPPLQVCTVLNTPPKPTRIATATIQTTTKTVPPATKGDSTATTVAHTKSNNIAVQANNNNTTNSGTAIQVARATKPSQAKSGASKKHPPQATNINNKPTSKHNNNSHNKNNTRVQHGTDNPNSSTQPGKANSRPPKLKHTTTPQPTSTTATNSSEAKKIHNSHNSTTTHNSNANDTTTTPSTHLQPRKTPRPYNTHTTGPNHTNITHNNKPGTNNSTNNSTNITGTKPTVQKDPDNKGPHNGLDATAGSSIPPSAKASLATPNNTNTKKHTNSTGGTSSSTTPSTTYNFNKNNSTPTRASKAHKTGNKESTTPTTATPTTTTTGTSARNDTGTVLTIVPPTSTASTSLADTTTTTTASPSGTGSLKVKFKFHKKGTISSTITPGTNTTTASSTSPNKGTTGTIVNTTGTTTCGTGTKVGTHNITVGSASADATNNIHQTNNKKVRFNIPIPKPTTTKNQHNHLKRKAASLAHHVSNKTTHTTNNQGRASKIPRLDHPPDPTALDGLQGQVPSCLPGTAGNNMPHVPAHKLPPLPRGPLLPTPVSSSATSGPPGPESQLGVTGPGGLPHKSNNIRNIRGPTDPLSNFYTQPVTINGVEYPTGEHFFQSEKCVLLNQPALAQQVMRTSHPHRAKTVGGKANTDFNIHTRTLGMVPIVKTLFRAKYAQNQAFRVALYNSRHQQLSHPVSSEFWGSYYRLGGFYGKSVPGQNMHAQILMDIRSELLTSSTQTPSTNKQQGLLSLAREDPPFTPTYTGPPKRVIGTLSVINQDQGSNTNTNQTPDAMDKRINMQEAMDILGCSPPSMPHTAQTPTTPEPTIITPSTLLHQLDDSPDDGCNTSPTQLDTHTLPDTPDVYDDSSNSTIFQTLGPHITRLKTPKNTWTLPPNQAQVLLIGDSNFGRLHACKSTIPDMHVVAMPGATARQLFDTIHRSQVTQANRLDQIQPKVVVINLGINHRQWGLHTLNKEVPKLISKATAYWQQSEIRFLQTNFSTGLPPQEQQAVLAHNALLAKKTAQVHRVSILPPMAANLFHTGHDQIHWTQATSQHMVAHIANHLILQGL